jgi:hypothetical protein
VLSSRYALQLTHFQSHYLPTSWQQRLHAQEAFGQLQVYLVDVYDVFLSKLFSARLKDRDDLRMLAPQLDRGTIVRRFRDTTQELLATPGLRQKAEENWYIIYGEPLPI